MVSKNMQRYLKNHGCYVVSEGTMRPQDLIPALLETLAEVRDQNTSGIEFDVDLGNAEDGASFIDKLFDVLNEEGPSGYYFGAQEGDGACYGFFKVEDLA